jgi:ubiquinone/menaquinone biosynthesis C-methylase UbiE
VTSPAHIKACCAAAYSSDAVALLLGDSYHPGGTTLTRRLATLMELAPGQRVADIASGPGATARLLAAEYGVAVEGIDMAERNVEQARQATCRAGLSRMVHFHSGDAEQIPFADNMFDAVVTECSYCTFPDKRVAATEFARILRPAGRLGLADVTTAEAGLPEELTSLSAWAACVADARPLDEYCRLLTGAGLRVIHTEQHDKAVGRMVEQIEARLHLARMVRDDVFDAAGVDLNAALSYVDIARRALGNGLVGYALVVAEKP